MDAFSKWYEPNGEREQPSWGYLTQRDLMRKAYEAGYKKAVETLTQHIRIDPDV